MSSSVGSCISCCHLGDELLLGVITGYGRDCQVKAVSGLGGSVWAVGGMGGAWAEGSDDSVVVGDVEDWSSAGSAASSCCSWAIMSEVGLSVSSGDPVGGGGSGPGDGAWESSSGWGVWSLYVSV